MTRVWSRVRPSVWRCTIILLATMLFGTAAVAHVVPAAQAHGGNNENVVRVQNTVDNLLIVRGSVVLQRHDEPIVDSVNIAEALASCTDCQTIVVALQLVVTDPNPESVVPQNAAVAVNNACTRCQTEARAVQEVFALPDRHVEVSHEVIHAVEDLDDELAAIAADPAMTFAEASVRIADIASRFEALARQLQASLNATPMADHHEENRQ